MSHAATGHQGYQDGYHRREYDPPTDPDDDRAAEAYRAGYAAGREQRAEEERCGLGPEDGEE